MVRLDSRTGALETNLLGRVLILMSPITTTQPAPYVLCTPPLPRRKVYA